MYLSIAHWTWHLQRVYVLYGNLLPSLLQADIFLFQTHRSIEVHVLTTETALMSLNRVVVRILTPYPFVMFLKFFHRCKGTNFLYLMTNYEIWLRLSKFFDQDQDPPLPPPTTLVEVLLVEEFMVVAALLRVGKVQELWPSLVQWEHRVIVPCGWKIMIDGRFWVDELIGFELDKWFGGLGFWFMYSFGSYDTFPLIPLSFIMVYNTYLVF